MSDTGKTLTKKDLHAKIESLEKELYLYKNRTQLARNYSIVKGENEELQKKLHQKKEYWQKWAKDEQSSSLEVVDDGEESE